MHKDELLQLHSLLCQMKKSLVDEGLANPAMFDEYERLDVSPQHIHKSKTDHKKAVFLLGQGLTDLFLSDNESQREKLRERFSRMAHGKKIHGASGGYNSPDRNPERKMENLPPFAVAALSR